MRTRAGWTVALAGLAVACSQGATLPSTTPATTTVATTTSTIATTTSTTAPTTTVPPAVPVLDGVIGEDEWGRATVTTEAGLSIWWRDDGAALHVAVRADWIGAVNLLVAEGDRVRVLHSSAALGSALYAREGPVWVLQSDFDWCCRTPGDTAATEALLAEEGWTASMARIGAPGDVEFLVVTGGEAVRIAVSWVGPDGTAIVWPEGLPEAEEEALYGVRRDEEWFDPAAWQAAGG